MNYVYSIFSGLYCQIIPNIGQYGIYELTVDDNKSCNFQITQEPISPYTRKLKHHSEGYYSSCKKVD